MQTVALIQAYALLALGVVFFVVELFALIEAARGSAVMFQAHGKLTKPIWLAILAAAALMGFIALRDPFSLPGIIGIVAAGIFLADVRPLVRGKSRPGDGPYGPW